MPKKLIGTEPYQVPRNADLGTNAFQDAESVNITGGVISLGSSSTTGYFQDTAISDVKPSLMLDFANTKTLDPRITFTRDSTATYYDGKTTAMAEQNLLTYSQDFDNAAWLKSVATVVPNAAVAPDGTMTADLLIPGTTGTWKGQLYRNVYTSGTQTIYVKSAGRRWFCFLNAAANAGGAWFDLINGVVGTVISGMTASITPVGNGWYRCSAYYSTTPLYIDFLSTDADNSSAVTLNGNEGVYIWGAQLEQRSTATAYTPTTSSAITNYIPALQTAAAGVPRFDHDPVTGESKGFLIEEQRTNLLTYSADFSKAAWGKTNATITADMIVAPDGTATAGKLVEDSTNTRHQFYQSGGASGQTFSIYAKAAERSILGAWSGAWFSFNLSTGVVTGSGATITHVGNGWYRCAAPVSARVPIYFGPAMQTVTNDATWNYQGDGVSGIYIWGAQLEAGSFATSYIPTTSAQVTRSADAASMTGANFSSWFRQDEGTIYSEAASVTVNKAICVIDDGTMNNRLQNSIASGYAYNFAVVNNGTAVADFYSSNQTQGTYVKSTGTYKADDFAFVVNSETASTDTSGSVPNTLSAIRIGAYVNGNYLNGTIKKIAYYPKRLSNAELQEMTL